jgi:hypothetical protein
VAEVPKHEIICLGEFGQRRQNLQWLFLELYLLSPLTQFPGVKIDLERTETNNS